MSINGIGFSSRGPNEVLLSDIRQQRQSEAPKWVSEDVRIMPEAGDSFMMEDKRQAQMDAEYEKHIQQNLIGDPDQTLSDLISARDFLTSSSIVVTSDNSTVLSEDGPTVKEAPEKMPKSIRLDANGEPVSENGALTKEDASIFMNVRKKEVGQTGTVGAFNIEWLGKKPRKDDDYKTIAQVIKDTGASVLGIEEIANVDGLQKVLKYLPDFGYILGKSGGQMLGIIFDKNRVKYDANSIEQPDAVMVGNPALRPPLSVDMKLDNFDFNFTVVHLKAGFQPDDLAVRKEQAEVLNGWIKDNYKNKKDKDFIMVGDYNDYVKSDALNTIDAGETVSYVTEDPAAKGLYTNIKYKSVIDHGAVSSVKGGAEEEYIKGSVRTVDENKYPGYKDRVSDHKPIVFDFNTAVDND
ncbi:MAG: hypothetical protein LWY06_12025 [Firmicutes bacterium]|nr:hypothetical protein [Bacillota bacterium]